MKKIVGILGIFCLLTSAAFITGCGSKDDDGAVKGADSNPPADTSKPASKTNPGAATGPSLKKAGGPPPVAGTATAGAAPN